MTGIAKWWRRQLSYGHRCLHRSHGWQWRCRKPLVYAGYCTKHHQSCFVSCDPEERARFYGPGSR